MSLSNITYYVCSKYSKYPSIGKERLIYTLYLVCWKTSLMELKDLARLDWKHGNNGPISAMVENAIANDARLKVESMNADNVEKERVSIVKNDNVEIADEVRRYIDEVYDTTFSLNFKELTDLVYSTYAILSTNVNETMILKDLAKTYVNQKNKKQ